jgi:hypothetical protein
MNIDFDSLNEMGILVAKRGRLTLDHLPVLNEVVVLSIANSLRTCCVRVIDVFTKPTEEGGAISCFAEEVDIDEELGLSASFGSVELID